MRKSREFKINLKGKEVSLHFRRPKQSELFDMDKAYRVAMTKLLSEGVMTEHKASRIFDQNGEWTKQDDSEWKSLAILIAQHCKILTEDADRPREESLKIVDKITELRGRQHELGLRRTRLFQNSAEGLAEQQKMHVFIRLCCCLPGGERAFPDDDSYQEFLDGENDEASKLLSEAYGFEYGVDLDKYAEDWPEVQFLKNLSPAEPEPAEASTA